MSRSLSSAPPITMTGPAVRSPSACSEPSSVMGWKSAVGGGRTRAHDHDFLDDRLDAAAKDRTRTTEAHDDRVRDRLEGTGRRTGRSGAHVELPRIRCPRAERSRRGCGHTKHDPAGPGGASPACPDRTGWRGACPDQDPRAGRRPSRSSSRADRSPSRPAVGPGSLGVLPAGRGGPRPLVGGSRGGSDAPRVRVCSRTR